MMLINRDEGIDLATRWRANHRPHKGHSEAGVQRVLADSPPTHKEAEGFSEHQSLRANPGQVQPIGTGQRGRRTLLRAQGLGGRHALVGRKAHQGPGKMLQQEMPGEPETRPRHWSTKYASARV